MLRYLKGKIDFDLIYEKGVKYLRLLVIGIVTSQVMWKTRRALQGKYSFLVGY